MQHIAAGGYDPVPYIFRKLFPLATFPSLTVCLYLEPLKGYKALNVSNRPKMQHIWACRGRPWGGGATTLCHTFLEISFHEQHVPRQ